MRRKSMLIPALLVACLAGAALADEVGPPPAYLDPDHAANVVEQIDALILWARGELVEHEGEGLYEDRPEDKALVEAMIERAQALRTSGDKAAAAGKRTEALSYYFAAEATARYAARMPHLLEDRLEDEAEAGHGHAHGHHH